MSQQMTQIIVLRVTPEEKNNWKLKAESAGISLSEYLRRCVERRKIQPPIPAVNYLTVAQLGRIGNNLNQQVKTMNIAVKLGQNIDNLSEVIESLSTIQNLLKKIQAELLGLS
jgi:Bacterial mobilisation protein (MobC)